MLNKVPIKIRWAPFPSHRNVNLMSINPFFPWISIISPPPLRSILPPFPPISISATSDVIADGVLQYVPFTPSSPVLPTPNLDIHDQSKNYDIYPTETATRGSNFKFVPGIVLSNVTSITPKIDEIRSVVLDKKIDIAAFTEIWLRDSIQDTIIDIPGYQIYRKDRNGGSHGGVCTYVRDGIHTTI